MADLVLKQIPVEISDVRFHSAKRIKKGRKVGHAIWMWMLSVCDSDVNTMNQVRRFNDTVGVAAAVSRSVIIGPQ